MELDILGSNWPFLLIWGSFNGLRDSFWADTGQGYLEAHGPWQVLITGLVDELIHGRPVRETTNGVMSPAVSAYYVP